MHDLCLEVLTVHGNELRLFWGQGILPTRTINVAHLTAQGTTVNVFSYDDAGFKIIIKCNLAYVLIFKQKGKIARGRTPFPF